MVYVFLKGTYHTLFRFLAKGKHDLTYACQYGGHDLFLERARG